MLASMAPGDLISLCRPLLDVEAKHVEKQNDHEQSSKADAESAA
jgi:hypothetical protein